MSGTLNVAYETKHKLLKVSNTNLSCYQKLKGKYF